MASYDLAIDIFQALHPGGQARSRQSRGGVGGGGADSGGGGSGGGGGARGAGGGAGGGGGGAQHHTSSSRVCSCCTSVPIPIRRIFLRGLATCSLFSSTTSIFEVCRMPASGGSRDRTTPLYCFAIAFAPVRCRSKHSLSSHLNTLMMLKLSCRGNE